MEAEILLAERRADWNPRQPHTFEQRLATAVPLQLYACCLSVLYEKFSRHPKQHDQLQHNLSHFVTSEIKFLQQTGQWPANIPPLKELL